jgi:hypothetical protein
MARKRRLPEGLTEAVRELRAHLEERYQVPVFPGLISAVTDDILLEVEGRGVEIL